MEDKNFDEKLREIVKTHAWAHQVKDETDWCITTIKKLIAEQIGEDEEYTLKTPSLTIVMMQYGNHIKAEIRKRLGLEEN